MVGDFFCGDKVDRLLRRVSGLGATANARRGVRWSAKVAAGALGGGVGAVVKRCSLNSAASPVRIAQ